MKDTNYAAYGLAGLIATVITGYIVYKNNKKVQEKVDSVVETVKEKTETEKVQEVKEKIDTAKTNVKGKVKKGFDKACIKAFEFALEHPKAAKAIVYGITGVGVVGLGLACGAAADRRHNKICEQRVNEALNKWTNFDSNDKLNANYEKIRTLCSDITLDPRESYVINALEGASGKFHTIVTQIYKDGENFECSRF